MSVQQATLHQLKIFLALGQHLSMAKVARELHLTPSAVSIQIKQLSETVGQPVYEQIGKKLFLTDAGKVLYEGCREMFEGLERLEQSLAELQGVAGGSLSLAVITTSQFFVPHMLADFCKVYPDIEVRLEVSNREGILDRLERNLDDFYIMGQPPENLSVVSVPFLKNPLMVVAPADHPLAREKGITPARLAQEPFIMRELGSGTRLSVEKYFAEHGLTLNTRMVLGSDEAVHQAVVDGLGIAVMSQHFLGLEGSRSDAVALLDVDGFPLTRQWHALYPTGKRLTPLARSFLEFLESEARRYSAIAEARDAGSKGKRGAKAKKAAGK